MPVRSDIRLTPSAFDQSDMVARTIRWWVAEVVSAFGVRPLAIVSLDTVEIDHRLPSSLSIALDETDAFVAQYALPKGHPQAHRSALLLRIRDLAPVDPATLEIAAGAVGRDADASLTYAVAMARRVRLEGIEAIARRKGARRIRFHAERSPETAFFGPNERRRRRRAFIFDAAVMVSVALALAVASTLWTQRYERETRVIEAQEKNLRQAAVGAETARRQAELARSFINRGILRRRAGVALEALADLNRATPDTAWWSAVHWTPDEVQIDGASSVATEALDKLSAEASGWSIALSGSLSAGHGQPQTFEVRARPKPEPEK